VSYELLDPRNDIVKGRVTFSWDTPWGSGDNKAQVVCDETSRQYVSTDYSFNGTSNLKSPEVTFTLENSALTTTQLRAEEKEKEAKEKMMEAAVEMKKVKEESAKAMRQLKEEKRDMLKAERDRVSKELNAAKRAHEELEQRLATKGLEVETEEKEISGFKVEREDPKTKLIVFLGKTGSGKSTTCNRFLGDTSEFGDGDGDGDGGKFFKTSDEAQSCTQENGRRTVTIDEHKITEYKITVVDTPGLYDSNEGKDQLHSDRLCAYLKGCGGINAFVFVHNEKRFDQSFQGMLKAYYRMFKAPFFERMVIVRTGIDGIERKKWDRKKGPKGLTGEIRKHFNLDFEIPVIPIGLIDYEDFRTALAGVIPDDKLEIKEITSPLQGLKEEYAELARQENDQRKAVIDLQDKLSVTNGKWLVAQAIAEAMVAPQY